MVAADAALFTGLGHYWAGMAQILHAELEANESEGLKRAVGMFHRALEQFSAVREREERILAGAQSIAYSAFFVRRHEVISQSTEALVRGLEALTQDLAEGYYPAAACSVLNPVMTRLMANIEHNARIEGVVSRFEKAAAASAE